MKQVTLISLYGEKTNEFSTLIAECQRFVSKALGAGFTPYDPRQVHATIIGLEHRVASVGCNANFATYRARQIVMDFDGFLGYLRTCGHFPFDVQIGGFASRDYPFTSRKTTPFERSFSIQRDKVVVMGWPLRGEPFQAAPATRAASIQEARIYPLTLDVIRHAAQRYGILHGQHRRATDTDNDLFFRIGLVDPKAPTLATPGELETQVRQWLSMLPPLVIEIRLDDVCVAAYEDDRLPLSSTQVWSLADPRVTGTFIGDLFA